MDREKDASWKWCAREEDSTSRSSKSQIMSVLEDSIGNDLPEKCESQSLLLNDLKNLRVKSNRGRPRKKNRFQENKYFKIPFRRGFAKKDK